MGIGLNASLYMGANALQAQTAGVQTAGRNIANINTPGATRQRVLLNPDISINVGNGVQGTGVAVDQIAAVRSAYLDAQVVSQNSDASFASTANSLATSLQSAFGEDLTSSQVGATQNTTTGTGLTATLGRFFDAWKSLEATPDSTIARDAVSSAASDLVKQIKTDYNNVLDVKQGDFTQAINVTQQVNILSSQIAQLNAQIAKAEGAAVRTGQPGIDPQANDLRDQRQSALESLGKLVSVKVTDNQGPLKDLVNVELANNDGTSLNPPIQLVNLTSGAGANGTSRLDVIGTDKNTGTNITTAGGDFDRASNNQLTIVASTGTSTVSTALKDIDRTGIAAGGLGSGGFQDYVAAQSGLSAGTVTSTVVQLATPPNSASNFDSGTTGYTGTGVIGGQLGAYINSANTTIGSGLGSNVGGSTVEKLNNFVQVLVSQVNTLHKTGFDTGTPSTAGSFIFSDGTGTDPSSSGNPTVTPSSPLTAGSYTTVTAGNLQLVSTYDINTISYDRNKFAVAAAANTPLDGSVALSINNIRTNPASTNTNPVTAYTDAFSKIGSDAAIAARNDTQQSLLLTQTTGQQQSVSGISMDEELTNLTTYQKAYQASARYITTVADMLDTLIQMGT